MIKQKQDALSTAPPHLRYPVVTGYVADAVSAAGDDDELDDQKAAAVENAIGAPETIADFDLGTYHARLSQQGSPTVCTWSLSLAIQRA